MQTPFFPAFRSRLAPMRRRVEQLRKQSLCHLESVFLPFLPPGLLSQADEGENSRERIYSVWCTFFAFLYQVLNPKTSCREVVMQVRAMAALAGSGCVEQGTGGFCQARQRLPLETLQRARAAAASHAQRSAPCWHGLHPRVIDGTTINLPDTAENQAKYPQSTSQKPGCGFPIMKLVAVFSLTTGVLLDYAKGNLHQAEMRLLKSLLSMFKPGDLVIGDKGFCCYALMALLFKRNVPTLMRLPKSRGPDMRSGKRLGKEDRLVVWRRPTAKPCWMPWYLWRQTPKELTVRVLRSTISCPGFRTTTLALATTLLDPQTYPAVEIAQLYRQRWKIELWFRNIKSSMGMEELRTKTPKMVHKELEMYFIAYNFIRCMVWQAAAANHVKADRISFKSTVDSLRQFSIALGKARSKRKRKELIIDLFEVIALNEVPDRPGRREPRAVKRRPKPFDRLTKPRHVFKETPHRSRYRKKQKPNHNQNYAKNRALI